MAGPNGGVRPNAGRKSKAEKFAGTINLIERKIADRLPQVVDRMVELADGVMVEETDQEGGVHVYRKPPDFKACAYLIDRILGKTTERKEVQAVVTTDFVLDLSLDDSTSAQSQNGTASEVLDVTG